MAWKIRKHLLHVSSESNFRIETSILRKTIECFPIKRARCEAVIFCFETKFTNFHDTAPINICNLPQKQIAWRTNGQRHI